MLDTQIVVPYSNDGIAANTNHTFDKRANEVGGVTYKDAATTADPSLPAHYFSATVTEAKASKQSYGVNRVTWSFRRMIEVNVPGGGTTFVPVVVKGETSIPVGTPMTTVNSMLSELKGFVDHDVFKRLVRSLET